MMRLKATKTSLYNLVASREYLPEMRETEFIKAPRCRDWWLKWYDGDMICKAFLSACMGSALLTVEKHEWLGTTKSREVYRIAINELRVRGMIEERE